VNRVRKHLAPLNIRRRGADGLLGGEEREVGVNCSHSDIQASNGSLSGISVLRRACGVHPRFPHPEIERLP
jgi:hypothetical protein